MSNTVRSYKPEIKVTGDPKWYDNALRFAKQQDALDYAIGLFHRWTQAEDYRAAESSDRPNSQFDADGLVVAIPHVVDQVED